MWIFLHKVRFLLHSLSEFILQLLLKHPIGYSVTDNEHSEHGPRPLSSWQSDWMTGSRRLPAPPAAVPPAAAAGLSGLSRGHIVKLFGTCLACLQSGNWELQTRNWGMKTGDRRAESRERTPKWLLWEEKILTLSCLWSAHAEATRGNCWNCENDANKKSS